MLPDLKVDDTKKEYIILFEANYQVEDLGCAPFVFYAELRSVACRRVAE